LELANMSTVSAPARRRPASAPPAPSATVRHGKCSLHLSIGGTRYRLTPLTPPAGFKAVWSLRKQAPEASAVYQVALEKGQQPACTCPDFTINGAVCKHIGSLRVLGLIPGRKPRPAAARRSHARRLASSGGGCRVEGGGTGPDGTAPPATRHPSPSTGFAAGFRRAVDEHLAMRRMAERIDGTPRPETDDPADRPFECAYCGTEFDPAISRDPHLCGPCAEEGGAR
jgi:SWIM zinc finger